MTIAEQLKQLGIEQGKQQQAVIMARYLLSIGVDKKIVMESSGLSLEKIRELNRC